jgi:hypothetical protein
MGFWEVFDLYKSGRLELEDLAYPERIEAALADDDDEPIPGEQKPDAAQICAPSPNGEAIH